MLAASCRTLTVAVRHLLWQQHAAVLKQLTTRLHIPWLTVAVHNLGSAAGIASDQTVHCGQRPVSYAVLQRCQHARSRGVTLYRRLLTAHEQLHHRASAQRRPLPTHAATPYCAQALLAAACSAQHCMGCRCAAAAPGGTRPVAHTAAAISAVVAAAESA